VFDEIGRGVRRLAREGKPGKWLPLR
jgi:hypothetical protein